MAALTCEPHPLDARRSLGSCRRVSGGGLVSTICLSWSLHGRLLRRRRGTYLLEPHPHHVGSSEAGPGHAVGDRRADAADHYPTGATTQRLRRGLRRRASTRCDACDLYPRHRRRTPATAPLSGRPRRETSPPTVNPAEASPARSSPPSTTPSPPEFGTKGPFLLDLDSSWFRCMTAGRGHVVSLDDGLLRACGGCPEPRRIRLLPAETGPLDPGDGYGAVRNVGRAD